MEIKITSKKNLWNLLKIQEIIRQMKTENVLIIEKRDNEKRQYVKIPIRNFNAYIGDLKKISLCFEVKKWK